MSNSSVENCISFWPKNCELRSLCAHSYLRLVGGRTNTKTARTTHLPLGDNHRFELSLGTFKTIVLVSAQDLSTPSYQDK